MIFDQLFVTLRKYENEAKTSKLVLVAPIYVGEEVSWLFKNLLSQIMWRITLKKAYVTGWLYDMCVGWWPNNIFKKTTIINIESAKIFLSSKVGTAPPFWLNHVNILRILFCHHTVLNQGLLHHHPHHLHHQHHQKNSGSDSGFGLTIPSQIQIEPIFCYWIKSWTIIELKKFICGGGKVKASKYFFSKLRDDILT